MIEIISLTKMYKSNVVLEDVSFNIHRNKINFIMAANGQGKTSFFKCLLNLENYRGNIIFDGNKFDEIIGEVFAVYDDSPLYTNLTGIQNIKVFIKNIDSGYVYDKFRNIFPIGLLEKKAGEYSYGQKKLLNIVMAILKKPKYLVIDEISNGLDYETMRWLKKILRELSLETTVVATGHQLDFYNDIIDYLYIINDKKIIEVDDIYMSEGLENVYEKFISRYKK